MNRPPLWLRILAPLSGGLLLRGKEVDRAGARADFRGPLTIVTLVAALYVSGRLIAILAG